jgi:hypothetical protein
MVECRTTTSTQSITCLTGTDGSGTGSGGGGCTPQYRGGCNTSYEYQDDSTQTYCNVEGDTTTCGYSVICCPHPDGTAAASTTSTTNTQPERPVTATNNNNNQGSVTSTTTTTTENTDWWDAQQTVIQGNPTQTIVAKPSSSSQYSPYYQPQ